MDIERLTGTKIKEWVWRYLPCEIAGTACELGGAGITYLLTGSVALAAIVATIGASAGYYGAAYTAAVRTTYCGQAHLPRVRRAWLANGLALRSIAIEFGPAEVIDSFVIRPVAFYVGPILFGGVIAGWIFGKIVADIGFYVLAIFSYEKFTNLLAVRKSAAEEVSDGSAPSIAAA